MKVPGRLGETPGLLREGVENSHWGERWLKKLFVTPYFLLYVGAIYMPNAVPSTSTQSTSFYQTIFLN